MRINSNRGQIKMNSKASLKIYLILCLVILLFSPDSRAQELIDRIVAVVNDDLITLSELQAKEKKINPNLDTPDTSPQQREILDLMIEEKLLEQEAKKLGITVTESDVDAAIEGVKKQFNLTDEQLNEVLKKQNLTLESFREQWRMQILGNKVVGTQVKGQIAVTEDEIKTYYEENQGHVGSGNEVRIAQILIPYSDSDEEQAAEKLAVEVTERAKSGEDFGELAKKYSKDTLSAERGGDLGYFKKEDLAVPLQQAIENVPTGDIVGPVKSSGAFHIIKVVDRRSTGDGSLDEVREEIRETIYRQKAEKALQGWLENVKKTAYIEVKL